MGEALVALRAPALPHRAYTRFGALIRLRREALTARFRRDLYDTQTSRPLKRVSIHFNCLQ